VKEQSRIEENSKHLLVNHIETQSKYYNNLLSTYSKQNLDLEKLLLRQIFSQQMMENLINDLLDLAKLENNSFQFSDDYFNLT